MQDRPKKSDFLIRQLEKHLPDYQPRIFDAINTRPLKNHHIGCALSHRSVIQELER